MEKKIKRTYEITDETDVAIKIRAANDHVKPSDIAQKAFDAYLGIERKKGDKK